MTLVPSYYVESVPAPCLVLNICLMLELISIGFLAGVLGSPHPKDFFQTPIVLSMLKDMPSNDIYKTIRPQAILLPLHRPPPKFPPPSLPTTTKKSLQLLDNACGEITSVKLTQNTEIAADWVSSPLH